MSKPPLPNFELDRYLPYRVTVLAAELSSRLARRYKSEFGITNPEWRVLLNVGYKENLSIKDIEKRVSLEKSKVSRAAARLEAKGLITKDTDPNDRRLVKLNLTDQGANMLAELVPIAQEFHDEINLVLGETQDALHEALDRLMGNWND